jgi:opacity protein-like surface antigen
MRIQFVIGLLCIWSALYGEQQMPGSTGARAMALASSSLTTADAWSGFNNCGALALLETSSISLAYADRLNLKELAIQSVAVNVKTRFGTLFSNFSYSGTAGFNEMRGGIGFAKKLGPRVALGAQALILPTKFSMAEPVQTIVSCDIGLLVELNGNFNAAFTLYNPVGSGYDAKYTHLKLPRIAQAGIGWGNQTILTTATVTVDSNNGLAAAIGLEYAIKKHCFVRTGYGTFPQNISAGTGFKLGSFTFDYAVRFIKMPGKLQSCTLSYAF